MSQGDRLVRALQRIGCPAANDLTGESLEWMFENQSCLSFLEWFIACIESDVDDNVLTDDELKRYNELVSSGEGIIEGEKLSEALSYMQSSGKENTPIDSLREEFQESKQKQELIEHRLHNLVFQRNKLSLHQAKTGHQVNQISEIEKKEKQKYKTFLEKSQVTSNQMDNAITELQHTVSNLTELYANKGDQPSSKAFLSQLGNNEYFESEEVFTTDLTAYTKRQFFEGIADMAGRSDKSRYDLLEISDPTSLLIRGENEEVTINDCKELTRLKLIYVPSETQRINAKASAVGVQAALRFAKEKSMLHHHQAADLVTLRDQVNEAKSSLSDVKNEILKITEKTLPSVIHELAVLQPTKVLKGDYNLKISRQDYFTSKQDQVINQLLCQRSRYEFLSMALEVEAFKNRETHRLLSAVESGLQQSLSELQRRINEMDNPALQPLDPRRGTIDSRDVFLGRVHKMLEPLETSATQKDSNLFQMYSQVLDWSNSLMESLQRLVSAVGSTEQTQTNVLRKLEQTLQQCLKVLYGKSNKSGGFTTVGLQRLDSLVQLEDLLSSLEQSIKDVIKDVEAKKKVLRSDGLKAMERDVFLCFFNDTSRLKRTVAELAARVDAQIVSN